MITPPKIEHPSKLPVGYQLIDTIDDPLEPDDDCLFLKYENILVIFTGGNWTNKKQVKLNIVITKLVFLLLRYHG